LRVNPVTSKTRQPTNPPKIASNPNLQNKENVMSDTQHTHAADQDVVEAIVPLMPIVLPAGGAVLIFLLAFIAVVMA
jgi:hypothetical protein